MKKSALRATWWRRLRTAGCVLIASLAMRVEGVPPPKPPAIPITAFWVGGADGGVWISLGKLQKKKFFASVYFETGKPWVSGWFVTSHEPNIDGESRTALTKQIGGFDGKRIFLKDRKTVYRLDKPVGAP